MESIWIMWDEGQAGSQMECRRNVQRKEGSSMTVEELKEKGAVYFEQIGTGIQNPDRYPSQIRRMTYPEACAALMAAWEEAGETNGFCDFYYFRLEREPQARVCACLTAEEQRYLKEMGLELERKRRQEKLPDIIFPLTVPLLQIAAKLNHQAILFSTFYFTGDPEGRSTWWGNYDQEYIIFRERCYGPLTVRK